MHAAPHPRFRPRRRGAIGAALRTNMAPMIDVVFLLLVFFMATTQWARDERVIAMDLAPRAADADPRTFGYRVAIRPPGGTPTRPRPWS